MSAIRYDTCSCCSRLHGSVDVGRDPPERCGPCEHRRGLCQHNLFARVAAGGVNVAHSSRPDGERGCEWVVFEEGRIRREFGARG